MHLRRWWETAWVLGPVPLTWENRMQLLVWPRQAGGYLAREPVKDCFLKFSLCLSNNTWNLKSRNNTSGRRAITLWHFQVLSRFFQSDSCRVDGVGSLDTPFCPGMPSDNSLFWVPRPGIWTPSTACSQHAFAINFMSPPWCFPARAQEVGPGQSPASRDASSNSFNHLHSGLNQVSVETYQLKGTESSQMGTVEENFQWA